VTFPLKQSVADRTLHRAVLFGMALCSFSALLLELTLTRLFSVVLFYHFAFLAISIALLGLGAGGVFAHLRKSQLARFETRALVSRLCSINALIVPVMLLIVLHIPVSLNISTANFLRLIAIYLAPTVPFFITGLEFSIVFARESQQVPPLYAADLAGGAVACLAVVPLLNWLGGPNTVLFTGACMALAGTIWAVDIRARRSAAARALFVLLLIAVNHSGKLFDIVYAKGKFRNPAWVEFARWNAISRVEVDTYGKSKAIVIDADASTEMMNVDSKHWHGRWESSLMSRPAALANVLRPHGDYAIIGPGGGVDVLRALGNGSPSVTGIEINPIIANTIMGDRYADYTFHLYQQPQVHIHVTDGRSFVRNAKQQFDVVQMTLVDTWASTAAGAFALSENSLYTVEAFREYFEHLKPDGMIAVTRWEFQQPREALRVVSVAMQALHEMGVANPSRNFIVVSEGHLDADGRPVVVLAKRSAFTAEELRQVQEHTAEHPMLFTLYAPSDATVAAASRLEEHYSPGGDSFAQLVQSNDPNYFAAHYPYDVSPVTDNAPFFFFTLKAGQRLHPKSLRQGIDWKVNLGVTVLGIVLAISVLAVLLFLLLPLAMGAQGQHSRPARLLYFIAVGIGYILVEIAFIQRFVLFLGHPVYALTVVVFLLLLSSGAGSMVSRLWLPDTERIWLPLVLIAAALLLYVVVLPRLLERQVGLPFLVKLLVSGGLLTPLGFAMGMPFPTGLRALVGRNVTGSPVSPADDASGSLVEWAWAMNAASSVLGSVLAIIIAIQFGLNVTLAAGAAAYLAAIVLTTTLRQRNEL
jgi:spermidine synthase